MTLALRPRQFVDLRRHDICRDAEPFQPVPGAPIAIETGMPAVDEHEHAAEARVRDPVAEIRRRQGVEFFPRRVAAPGVSEARQIDEVERRFALDRDPIEVGQAGLATGLYEKFRNRFEGCIRVRHKRRGS